MADARFPMPKGQFVAAVWLALSLPLAGQQLLDRVIVRVGDNTVTQTDVQAALGLGIVEPRAGASPDEDAVRQLIDRQLTLTELARFTPPEPDAAAVDEEVARMKATAGARLPEVLQSTGLDEPSLRGLARDTVRIRIYLEERFPVVGVSDADAEQYYRTHPNEFRRGGDQISFPDALADARAAVARERRNARVAQWLANLRARIEVTRPKPR